MTSAGVKDDEPESAQLMKTLRENIRTIVIMMMKRWNGMRVGYSCVAIMASVGVMVVEIGWQGKKQEELFDQDLETGTYHCPLSYILTAICKKKGRR